MTGPVRVALVGCGRLAEAAYAPALAAAPVVVAAVVDPDPARRHTLADATGAPAAASLADVLADGIPLDGVIVASPAPTHLAAATVAAEAGLPVLVEKPPAPDAAGARAIAALTPAPWIGFNRRFDPGAMAARVAARTAAVRGPLDLTVELFYRHRSWAPYAVDDDVLGDLGPHVVDWVRWITGAEVTTVTARADHHRAEVHAALTGGGTAAVRIASDRPYRERLTVVDAEGLVVADHRLGGPVAAVVGRLRPGPHLLVTTIGAQVSAFARAVRGQVSPLLGTAADGVAVMATVDAARRSAAVGSVPVTVDVSPATV